MVTKVEKIKKHAGRGRPVLLNDLLKQAVILYKSTNPEWSAEKILNSIKINHYNKLRKVHPDWPDSKIKEKTAFPGVNRVQRYLKEISPQLDQKSPLQEKWHLGTMNEYPITPEAVKKIFELKARGKDYISIRIARWISRLSVLNLPLDMLYLFAMEYSTAEEIAEISRTELNTANLDKMVLENSIDRKESGNDSQKQARMQVQNNIPPIKNEAPPLKNDIPVAKADTWPLKNDTETGEAKSPLPRAKVTLVKRDVPPVKIDIKPVEKDVAPAKDNIVPEKTDIKTVKQDVAPEKIDRPESEAKAPATDEKSKVEKPAEDEKPRVEKPADEEKPKDSLKKYYLPDMRKRQASIEAFLKFVEKQKDKEQ